MQIGYHTLVASAVLAIAAAQVQQGGSPIKSLLSLTASHAFASDANFTQLAVKDAAAKKGTDRPPAYILIKVVICHLPTDMIV
jgi:hypothetical protein